MFSIFTKRKPQGDQPGAAPRKLMIPEYIYHRMISHCVEEKPLEACGLLVGEGSRVLAGYAADNEHRSAVVYKVDDRQLLHVFREMRTDRQEIIAIYHSHVRTDAVPSRTDIEQATWPEAFYVIVSLAQRRPQVRAWRIVDRQVTEHQVEVHKEYPGLWRDLRQAVQPPGESATRPDIP